MADRTLILDSTVPDTALQFRDPEQDVLSETSEESTETHDNYRSFNYGYRSTNHSDDDADDDEEDEEDPYLELFMNAYRSAPQSSDDEEAENGITGCSDPAAKPLCLMEDWDLWDMDESELKERFKDLPQLLELITRKRKRRMLEEEETDAATALEDDELCNVMNRAVKCIRTEPPKMSS
uniref:Uncharacterized protein n=1 Tax=Anopheles minimus TaxID=112268 RepID=A0A182W6D0_9DIPT